MRISTNAGLIALTALTLMSCRTAGEPDPVTSTPVALTGGTPQVSKERILKRAIGALTTQYPENRIENCIILQSDLSNLSEVQSAISAVKAQPLADAFFIRAVIPSVQLFAYQGGEEILLSESSDKMRYRQPADQLGNPALDTLTSVIDAKCGAKNATP